jgi:phosphatidylserine/phosphatidylglycerophosphate/cardiolipin synthase-like enzyme
VSVAALIENVSALVQLEGARRVNVFADALEAGNVGLSTPNGALQTLLGVQHGRIRSYRDVLATTPNIDQLILALRTAAHTADAMGSAQTIVEVAWTYPGIARPGLRTTGGVAREIVTQCKKTLLLVGYSVTVDPALTGLAAQTIEAIARAAERGVLVTAVLHKNVNPQALLQAWSPGVRRPSIFRWVDTGRDDKAAIHAKVLIGDHVDALVTSANLTYHGFQGNLEMGLRVRGRPASEIHDRFEDLMNDRALVSWEL